MQPLTPSISTAHSMQKLCWLEGGTNLLRQKARNICVNLLLSTGACIPNVAKEDDSIFLTTYLSQHKASVTVLTYHHRADTRYSIIPPCKGSVYQRERATGHFIFLPSSTGEETTVRKQLSFLLSMLLLTCLTSEGFPHIPLPSSTSALALNAGDTLSPQVVTLVRQVWRIPDPQASRDQSVPLPEAVPGAMLVLPGITKNSTHMHTNKHNPCADGDKEQNQNHSF